MPKEELQVAPEQPVEQPPHSLIDYVPGTHSAIQQTWYRNPNLAPYGIAAVGVSSWLPDWLGGEVLGPGLLGAGALALTAAHVNYRLNNNKLLEQTADAYSTEQAKWTQPVDWKKDAVRWYGFDSGYHKPGFDPMANLGELARINEVARRTNRRVAVSSQILELTKGDDPYGYRRAGEDFLSHKIEDTKSAKRILVMSPKESDRLVHDLANRVIDIEMNRAITLLKQAAPTHPVVSLYNKHGLNGADLIAKSLRPRLEDRATDTSIYLERGTDGIDFQRRRSHSRGILKGQQLQIFSEAVLQDGSVHIRHDGLRHLTGQRTVPELLTTAAADIAAGKQPTKDIESAVWLLTYHYKRYQSVPLGNAPPTQAAAGLRLLNERPRLLPFLRLYGKGVQPESATLRYHSPARNLGILVLAASVMIGGGVKTYHHFMPKQEKFVDAEAFNGMISDASQSDRTVWKLQAVNGASTDGYWASRVDNRLYLAYQPKADATPPLKNTSIGFYREPIGRTVDHFNVTGERYNPKSLAKGTPYITVSGETTTGQLASFELQNDQLAAPYSLGFALPTREGSEVTTARLWFDDNKPTSGDISLFRNEDNTYSLRLQNVSRTLLEHSLNTHVHLEYRVVQQQPGKVRFPNAYTPVGVDYDNYALPFFISSADAATMRSKLKLVPVSAKPADVAAAVSQSHTYSNTPFADEHIKHTVTTSNIARQLKAIGLTTASLKSANCNIATLQTMLMTRGQVDERNSINPVEGFHVDSDASSIKVSDAHMWLTDQKGTTIDPTPSAITRPTPEHTVLSKALIHDLEIGAVALALLGFGGYRSRHRYKQYRDAQLAASLFPEDIESTHKLHRLASILEWLHYSSPTSSYDTAAIERQATSKLTRPLRERYRALPRTAPRDFGKLLKARGSDIPADERKQLKQFARQLRQI